MGVLDGFLVQDGVGSRKRRARTEVQVGEVKVDSDGHLKVRQHCVRRSSKEIVQMLGPHLGRYSGSRLRANRNKN